MSSRVRMVRPVQRMPSKSGRGRITATRVSESNMDMLSQDCKLVNSQNASEMQKSRRERKTALKQDVDKLQKKLWHEQNVHRALERAFSRPLGALPRLPPYLPAQLLELLAEVAVLEEEVVHLEEQVVNFRRGLYQEAIYISSSKTAIENVKDNVPGVNSMEQRKTSLQNGSCQTCSSFCSDQYSPLQSSSHPDHNGITHSSSPKIKLLPTKKPILSCNDKYGKENQLINRSIKGTCQSSQTEASRITKSFDSEQKNCNRMCIQINEDVGNNPNRISEDLLKCLSSIFSKISSKEESSLGMVPSISGLHKSVECLSSSDPYDICSFFGRRDIGPYKNLRSINHDTINSNLIRDSAVLIHKIRILLRKLESTDLGGLNHQEKLAFWINIYNSCLMNTFLDHGIPATPQLVVSSMQKATINVGGHFLSAMTIEHFILRRPFYSKHAFSKGCKNDGIVTKSNFGLDWPEPLVTFALSCGSWSSPAVRVYTPSEVESELELAKQDYLQAAIGISPNNKLAIPKLLDWYLLDFAKDIESLLDWICLQLPDGLRNSAVKCIERGKRGGPPSQIVQVLPYEFSFRYLLDK